MAPLTNILLVLFSCFPLFAKSLVPLSETFKHVNEGEFGDYIVEYDANYRTLPIASSPFQLCFYNTTPSSYTLGLRMGLIRSESQRRWVWEANRGNPVGENATLALGEDGNLVLANANGKIAWQTNTANKGVVGFKLESNGNLVLYDSKGIFIWQSFDYPTDTLFVGQSLKLKGPNKLVSRVSAVDNKNGPYSFVLEPKRLALYFKSPNSAKQYKYYSKNILVQSRDVTDNLTLGVDVEQGYTYVNLDSSAGVTYVIARPKYNATSSILRIDFDGNLKLYTYVDIDDAGGAWEETFILFDRDSSWETECQLPSRCGELGVCKDNQCVGCPSPKGLLGYSETCQPPELASCAAKDISYYKIEGVDSFISKYNIGQSIDLVECGDKCTKDCKCLGYFYNTLLSKCWIAYDLMTLTKNDNSTHLGFIKTPKVGFARWWWWWM